MEMSVVDRKEQGGALPRSGGALQPLADRAATPDGAEPVSAPVSGAAGIPSAEPLTEAVKEIAREALVACFRAAIAAAYSRQVRRGYTREVMAKRLGWSLKKLDRLLLVPRTIKLDEISDVCFAMGCLPEFETEDGFINIRVVSLADKLEAWRAAQGIEAEGGDAKTGPVRKDESPVGNADAPAPDSPPHSTKEPDHGE